jgi:nucleoside phosphorylase
MINHGKNVQPTVGIITALPKEYAAFRALLEMTEEKAFEGTGANRRYLLGEVPSRDGGKHKVALCLTPDMGNNPASARATLLLEHFPSIDAIIMVGIAGGVPNPLKLDEHVRLGDIVVSDQNGVIQYDFDKETVNEKTLRHRPRPPSAVLLEAVRLLQADELEEKYPWLQFIEKALLPKGQKRPSAKTDILTDSTNPIKTIPHPRDLKRKNNQPRLFLGSIASANKLLKNPIKRDELRDKFGVKAVEMEGSGIADATWSIERAGYLVIRGICDYCDSNKADTWQAYAAAVAAAYARALIESIPSNSRKNSLNELSGQDKVDSHDHLEPQFPQELNETSSFSKSESDKVIDASDLLAGRQATSNKNQENKEISLSTKISSLIPRELLNIHTKLLSAIDMAETLQSRKAISEAYYQHLTSNSSIVQDILNSLENIEYPVDLDWWNSSLILARSASISYENSLGSVKDRTVIDQKKWRTSYQKLVDLKEHFNKVLNFSRQDLSQSLQIIRELKGL